MSAHEIEAVGTAEPNPGSHDLIRAWRATGRTVSIVSNNGFAAIIKYLRVHGLSEFVNVVSARTTANPHLLKPSGHLLKNATISLDIAPRFFLMLDDSLTDVEASRRAKVRCIAYANKTGKINDFLDTEVDVIISGIDSINRAI